MDVGQSGYIERYQNSKLQSIRNQDDDDDDLDDDDLLQQLEDESDEALSKYRESRIQELSQEFKNIKQTMHNHDNEEDLGSVETITNEKKIMEIVLNHELVIIHFYQPNFEKCQVINNYLQILAEKHLQLKIIKIKAELAPFLVNKLNIKVLPFILIYKNSNELDRIIGFEKLGVTTSTTTTPSYQSFENYLLLKNVINRQTIKFGTLYNNKKANEDDEEDDLDI